MFNGKEVCEFEENDVVFENEERFI